MTPTRSEHNVVAVLSILYQDEVNQVLTTNVWLEQEWTDERLKWDPRDYNGLVVLRIPCEKIWLPDIVLYNSADDFTSGYMQSKAMVNCNGTVFWPPPAKFRSSCKIDITYFPFDDQTCKMKFGSWTYDGFQVDLTNRSAAVDLSNYVYSGEWELLDIRVVRNEVFYPCCIEPFPDVTFTVIMRRRTLYYLFNIIFPCLWLTILSLLGFWLPPDSGEKITLGITVLLAFSVFMLLIAENMPATSEFVPLIGDTAPDIVIGTETWLKPSIKSAEIFPSGFKIYRNDRKKSDTDKDGGGVLIAIKDHLISEEVHDLTPNKASESIWGKVNVIGSKTLYICPFYHPKTSDENSMRLFSYSIKEATKINNAAHIIGGDFNLPGWDWKNKVLKPKTNHEKIHYDFANLLDDTALTQLIDQPTRNEKYP
ncbi:acetylcholine receptor subunit alpha-like [Mizuhopecten yessoensis]|uniref:acetylcholine receptor subunit alpha-like n=1 Tax=Mizuhopecten yessoensis TaxID=6573 RepID=UPI000B45AC79|nr:acetylcholine receptor subunit alpha-like [Mizuhopecten yessoensis]